MPNTHGSLAEAIPFGQVGGDLPKGKGLQQGESPERNGAASRWFDRPDGLLRDGLVLLADVRQQGHEAGTLDGILDGALEGGAIAASFTAEQFTLAGAEFLERLHVFEVNEGWPWTPFRGAEPTTVFPSSTEFLANHGAFGPTYDVTGSIRIP